MDLYAVLEQALDLLQWHGWVAYRALKLQFALDDDYLEALTDELIYARRLARTEQAAEFQDENAILEVLASQPTPEQVLALRPSQALQMRVSTLLEQQKNSGLSHQEEAELDRYLLLKHLVRLAKAHAYQQLAPRA